MPNDQGILPIHLAAIEGNLALADLLIAWGGDINAEAEFGRKRTSVDDGGR